MALPPSGSSIPVAQVPTSMALPQVSSLDNTFGALAVGTYVGLVWVSCSCLILGHYSPIFGSLYGVSMHQAYRYFRLYPNDSTWLKSLVCVLRRDDIASSDSYI